MLVVNHLHIRDCIYKRKINNSNCFKTITILKALNKSITYSNKQGYKDKSELLNNCKQQIIRKSNFICLRKI